MASEAYLVYEVSNQLADALMSGDRTKLTAEDSANLNEFLERFRLHSQGKPGKWTHRKQGELTSKVYWFDD